VFELLSIRVAVLPDVIIRDVGLARRLSMELGIRMPANATGFKQFILVIFPAPQVCGAKPGLY
jgi:hypothetical protein